MSGSLVQVDRISMQDRVAMVIGTSRGIGTATALAFAHAGAAVVLGGRDTAAMESVVDRIEAEGGRAIAVAVDVRDLDSMQRLVDRGVATFGRLDFAFNNAAAGPMPAPLAEIDPEEFDLALATVVRGTFLGMKFQVPAIMRSGGGAVVNMASIAGINGIANLAAYVASKAAVIGLTKVAALDYADQGVRVNAVAPGPHPHSSPGGSRGGGAAPGGNVNAHAPHWHGGGGGKGRVVALLAAIIVRQWGGHPD